MTNHTLFRDTFKAESLSLELNKIEMSEEEVSTHFILVLHFFNYFFCVHFNTLGWNFLITFIIHVLCNQHKKGKLATMQPKSQHNHDDYTLREAFEKK